MSPTPAPARSRDLGWPFSLGFKLLILALILLVLCGAAGYFGARALLGAPLEQDIRQHELAVASGLASRIDSLTLRVEAMAGTLARLAATTPGGGAALRPPAPQLLEAQNLAPAVSALGFWPEPNSVDVARDRASSYWVLGTGGRLEARDGYNDPRAVPYYRESWYTPARYAPPDRCYWTPAYFEPLVKREIVSCAMAIRSGTRFAGVVTLSIGLDQISPLMETGGGGHALLVDAFGQLLGASAAARPLLERGGKPRNVAELAQRLPGFNPLALVLHRQSETASASVAPAQVAELVKATREFAAADAGRALAAARWRADEHALAPQHLRLDADPVTGSEASAVLIGLPASGWSLVSLLPADRGLVGARQLVVYTLALAGTLGALMLLSFALFVRVALLAPLRRMVARLSTITAADKPGLHERPRNEIGALAYWINERLRQLREQADHAGAGQLQLSLEAKERRALIERLARFQERAAPALQTVRDAVIAVDDQGLVDDMNPAAQQMTGVSLTAARGRPLADIVDASSTTSDVTAASALTTAMQRGSRIDPREDFQLRCGTGAPREIRLSIIPQRSAGGRSSGAVLVLYERADGPRTAPPAAAAISLPRRAACEQRIGELAAASKAQKRRNAVLVVDLDRLSDINREAGRAAGDEAIRKLGELLVEKSAGHGHAYHLHADRYALLLPGFDTARAKTFAEALRDGVARLRLGAAAQPTGMTVCVGIAEFGADAPPADMLPRAEDACAAAKRGGRNKVRTYDPSMERATRDVADDIWIKRVRTGIDQNRMHLTTQFVAAQRPGGGGAFFESLLALEDEEGFWSTATAFMPASERHGLAAAVDRWHIGSVAAQLTRGDTLQKVGLVSIRISQSSIFDAELPDFLIKLLEHHKTLSGRLCLELTESSLLAYPQQSGALAEVLRVIGIRMAVSDFLGREPSTLALIRHLPVEFLRVDAGRFPALATEASEQKLADSVLHLARLLERQTWVYGLDDAEQLERWRRLNPDLLQGAAIAAVSPVLFQQPR